jgi:zinc/manganese transport system ATP-binding protein
VAAARSGPASVALRNVTLAYGRVVVLENLSGAFSPASMTAIVGPNGAGKSTLLTAVAGILRPAAGVIEVSGASRVTDIAYLPQSDAVDREFPISVLEFVALGRWRRFGAFAPVAGALLVEVMDALHAVGLAGFAERPIGELSVGQFRRALFARVLLQDAAILLLDEPFAGVDAATTADLMALVRRWHAEGRTVVSVLHDLHAVLEHFPLTLLLAPGFAAWGETADVLTPEALARAGIAPRPETGRPHLRVMPP